jgi:hypothetical protein
MVRRGVMQRGLGRDVGEEGGVEEERVQVGFNPKGRNRGANEQIVHMRSRERGRERRRLGDLAVSRVVASCRKPWDGFGEPPHVDA